MNQNRLCFYRNNWYRCVKCRISWHFICLGKRQGFYIPFPENQDEAQLLAAKFKPFFENEAIEKIGQNMKYDLKVLRNYGLEVKGPLFDTMIAHYLINPDMRHNMDVLAETYLKYSPRSIETLIGKKEKDKNQCVKLL